MTEKLSDMQIEKLLLFHAKAAVATSIREVVAYHREEIAALEELTAYRARPIPGNDGDDDE